MLKRIKISMTSSVAFRKKTLLFLLKFCAKRADAYELKLDGEMIYCDLLRGLDRGRLATGMGGRVGARKYYIIVVLKCKEMINYRVFEKQFPVEFTIEISLVLPYILSYTIRRITVLL